jgi:hypothetical protein
MIRCGAAAVLGCLAAGSVPARADDPTLLAQTAPGATPAPPPSDQAPAATPASGAAAPTGLVVGPNIHLNAQIEGGISVNPLGQHGNENFGQLFTDHNNQFQLNQILLTAHRDLDPKNPDFDIGFRLQGLYGSDARYTHFLGELDTTISSRYQLDIVEADVSLHLPVLFEGGVDLKVGQYPTPLGYEVIDPSTNPFYSHSYIYNFGVPVKHTGGYAVAHVNSVFDLYAGVDTGTNTTFGRGDGDNNGAAAGLGGFQLTLLDGKLTVLALTHFGAENSYLVVPNAGSHLRFYNDAVITYKATDKLTLVTELDFARDDYGTNGRGANAFGAAQYASYTLSDEWTANARAEYFRDDNGFFVASFPGNLDIVKAQFGLPNTSVAVGQATYSEYTIGATYKPAGLPDPIAGLLIRPEARLDYALTNTKAYNGLNNRVGLTFATDFILQF